MKTVELIVEEGPWDTGTGEIPMSKMVSVRVDVEEVYLRKLGKAAGGRWNRSRKVWELAYRDVLDVGLTDRMVDEGRENV